MVAFGEISQQYFGYRNTYKDQYNVWCKTSARIMTKCGEECKLTFLMHLAFWNQHFEPIEIMILSNLQSEISKIEWGPNFNNNIPIQKTPLNPFMI
jgi:hypothetical protein